MSKESRYDALVIGAGSAGVRFARTAASLGAKVAVVEERYLGGTCVNVGCVPKKLFVYGSKVTSEVSAAHAYGWDLQQQPKLNWGRLRDNKTEEIERLNGIYRQLLEKSGVEIIEGHAHLISDDAIQVGGEVLKADRIVIATGGWPDLPEVEGVENFITSNEFFYLDQLPNQAVVYGGGYIAVEFAGILNGLGVDTTLVYRGPLFLRGFEQEIRESLAEQMEQQGVHLKFGTTIKAIKAQTQSAGGHYDVVLSDGSEIQSDLVLACTGRKPNLKNLGLDEVGVKLSDRGYIQVDPFFQTNRSNIYALGDVVGRMALTPVALREGMTLAHNLFAKDGSAEDGRREQSEWQKVDYQFIPTAVFSQPEIATVGYTEDEAKAHFGDIEIFISKFRPLKHTLTGKPEQSVMKMIVKKDTQQVVGLHLLGSESGEIIQGFAVAMKMGATKADFDSTVGVHPTSAEELVTLR